MPNKATEILFLSSLGLSLPFSLEIANCWGISDKQAMEGSMGQGKEHTLPQQTEFHSDCHMLDRWDFGLLLNLSQPPLSHEENGHMSVYLETLCFYVHELCVKT